MKTKTIFLGLIILIVLSYSHNSAYLYASNTTPFQQTNNDYEISKTSDSIHVDSVKYSDNDYFIEKLDNTNGLSMSSVNAIFQDSENVLWIGTWDGLNRYNGNDFKIFRPQLNDDNNLSNQVILKITEDSSGLIWILTMNGISSYQKSTDIFKYYEFPNKNEYTLLESEFNIAANDSKELFCVVKNWGIGYFDGSKFQNIENNLFTANAAKEMKFKKTGELLILFENNELYLFDFKSNENGGKIISKREMISSNVRTFEIFQNDDVCIVSNIGNAWIQSTLTKERIEVSRTNVQFIIGKTSKGLLLYDKTGYFILKTSGLISNELWLSKLEKHRITTLISGTENIIWAGTDGDGLLKIYPNKKPFKLISKKEVPELDQSIVRAFVVTENGSLFVGTKGKGLFKFTSKNYLNYDEPLDYKNFNEATSSINNSIYALCKGQEDLIFIGTDGDGISVFDLKSSKIVNWSEILDSNLCDYFRSTYAIYQDDNGFIWLGTNGYGLMRMKITRIGKQLKVSNFKSYRAGSIRANSLSSNIIYSIIPKNKESIWIGTRLGGLNLFDIKSETFKIFKNDKNNSESISNNDVLSLHIDRSNKLWVGTSLGLNLLDEINNVFSIYTIKNGLPNNTIHGIISDKNDNLWISTNFGLSNFIVKENKFINFTTQEGLQNNEFADGAYFQEDAHDFVFMGGINGFNYFSPSKIKESNFIPDLLIDNISGQNQKKPYYQGLVISPDSNAYPSIVLDYNQNFFDIELSALSYINSEKCQYAYQLKNFDQDWNNIGNRRNISFTNVPPGKYSLWLKWSNSDGIWSDSVQAIDIQIKPIFWRSNTALIMYSVLLFLFLLFVLSYYKKQQLLKQNIIYQKRDEEIHQNRLTFFTNIAHEFQTPLTLIIGPVQKLSETSSFDEKNQKFIRMIQRNSSRLLFLTQQLLEFRKAEYDHLEVEVKQFDLVNLVEQIAELFDEWALDKNINYTLSIPPQLIGWFDKDKIEKIVFNLLSNAFKYTSENGKIKIQFHLKEGDVKSLIIKVSNTGKGIPKEKLNSLFDRFFLSDNSESSKQDKFRTGIGLAYIKKLITVLKGKINVTSKVNKITVFTVSLPCNKEAFNEKYFDKEVGPILISHHLKNILEDVSSETIGIPNKISALESIINKRKIVLIVEDEKEIQLFLNELLEEEYKVVIANNGIEALEVMKKELPDIIISDVMMPLMDGVELCKKVKKELNTCHIPFIMLTAKNSIIHRIEGLESGANSYIPKPFYPEHILIRVRKLIEEQELILKHLNQDAFFENLTDFSIKAEDKEFIKRIVQLIRENIDNDNLQSLFIEKNLGISNSQLYRKIKQIFSLSPGDLIRTIRLKHAADLLQKGTFTVSEVCYQSGFNNRSYFYREFNKMYNLTPKNYQLKYNSKH